MFKAAGEPGKPRAYRTAWHVVPMFLIEPRQRRRPATRTGKVTCVDLLIACKRFLRREASATGLQRRLRATAPALLFGGTFLIALPGGAFADPSTDDLKQLRATIQKELSALKKQEDKLHQQILELDRKSKLLDLKNQLLDRQLSTLRATGLGTASSVPPAPTASSPAASAPSPEVAQTPAAAISAPTTAPAGGGGGTAAPAAPPSPGGGDESAPISGPLGSAAAS